jgi:predicted RNA-binding protein with PUA-like domain
MNYWLMKSEPDVYSMDDLKKEGQTLWDGVRNYQARNFLKLMGLGDQVLIYHSGTEKALVGLAQVSQSAFPDPKDEAWVAVKLLAIQPLSNPVTLSRLQAEPSLAEISLLKQSRLSVHSLSKEAYQLIQTLSL